MNASLVVVAFATMVSVAGLIRRERRYAELLTDDAYGQLSAAQKDIVERMRRSIRGALALIKQINTLAKAEAGHLEIAFEPVDVGEPVRSIGDE